MYFQKTESEFSSAADIGIIEATAIFIGTKDKKENIPHGVHELPLYSYFSVPSLRKEEASSFILKRINAKYYDDKEYDFSKGCLSLFQ